MGGAALSANQMAEIKQIPIVGQATGQNNGLQHTSLLQHRHVTHVRQLFVYPLFQPKVVPEPNLKRMGTGSDVPWRISRSRMEEAKGAKDTSISWQQMESHTRPGGGGK